MSTEITIGARLDRLPVAKFHRRVLWLIALGLFFDTFDIWLAGGVVAALVKSNFATVKSSALFISVTGLGLGIGALAGGYLGDHYGRKFSYQFNLLIFGLGSLAAALVPNMTWLIALRFLMAVGLGAEVVIGYGTIAEFVPARVRGTWLGYTTLIANFSFACSALLAVVLVPISWRYMFIIVAVGALFLWFSRRVLTESPRWLESKGLHQKAEEVVSSIEKEVEKEKGPLPPVVPSVKSSTKEEQLPWLCIFKGKLLGRTITASLTWSAQSIAAGVWVVWLPTLLMRQGIDFKHSLGFTAAIALGGPVGGLIALTVIDRFSRKWLVVITALLCALFGIIYSMQVTPTLLIISGAFFMCALFMYNSVNFATYVPEMFPTNVRLRATGFVNVVGRVCLIISPFWAAYILEKFNSTYYVYFTVVVIFIIAAISVIIWGPETRKKTIEEIG